MLLWWPLPQERGLGHPSRLLVHPSGTSLGGFAPSGCALGVHKKSLGDVPNPVSFGRGHHNLSVARLCLCCFAFASAVLPLPRILLSALLVSGSVVWRWDRHLLRRAAIPFPFWVPRKPRPTPVRCSLWSFYPTRNSLARSFVMTKTASVNCHVTLPESPVSISFSCDSSYRGQCLRGFNPSEAWFVNISFLKICLSPSLSSCSGASFGSIRPRQGN